MPLRLRLLSSSLLARGVAVAVLVSTAVAFAGSGVQVTRDGKRTLVNKDLSGERWAITCEEDGTITGNVFRPDGGPAAFVWCEPVSDDGNPDPYERIFSLDCYGADACPVAPCGEMEWRFIATAPLPGAF